VRPAVSVPAGRTASGAPVGLQIVARPGADLAVLALVGASEIPATAEDDAEEW
jgi:amidase